MLLKPIATILFSSCILSAWATEFVSTNAYTATSEQSITEELWIAANTVDANGVYKNDLFVFSGSDMQLNGAYENSLWGSSGGNTVLNGISKGNVRLAGQNIRINGTIEGNLIAAALNSIVIGTNANITGSVRLIGLSSIILEGTVGGPADISSMKLITLDGSIQGDTKLSAPEIILSDDARLSGTLVYRSGTELIPAGNVVAEKLERIQPESPYSTARIKSHAMWFLAALLVGVAFISLFPMTTAMASLLARKSPLKCLLVGFIAVGAIPIFAMVSISSGIGLPLGAIMLASWGILVYVSRIIMGMMIGTAILRSGNTSAGRVLLAMASGLALIYLFTFIPSAISGIVQLIVVWMGMGALLLALLQKRRLIIQVPEELKQLEALKNEQNKPTEESQ